MKNKKLPSFKGEQLINIFRSAMNARFFICATMVMAQVIGSMFGFGMVSVNELFSIPATHAAEGIAHTINYQGKLMDSSGGIVSDGNYGMKFSIYDSASGGSQLWTASSTLGIPTGTPENVSVAVENGLFSLLLGDTSADQVAFPDDLFNKDELYLGVTIGSDSEMTPRKRLSAVPYAYNSEMLQGQHASGTVDGSLGGDLFALNQNSDTPASATRTALGIYTSGTSDTYDYLIRGNSGSDVFTVTRAGNVSTTGNLQVDGATIVGSATTTAVTFNGYVSSDFNPYSDLTYNLGSSAYRWLGLNVANVTSTNVTTTNLAAGYVTTSELWVDGTQITGAGSTSNLQQVTDQGATTTNRIQFAGATSTNNILPGTNLAYDLGSSSNRWRDVWASSTRIGTSTWDLWQANEGFTISEGLANRYFTISHSGNVGIGTNSPGIFKLQIAGNTGPDTDLTYSLGSSSYRWLGLAAANVSSTNIDALGYVSTTNLFADESNLGNATTTNLYNSGTVSTTELYVNGTQITGASPEPSPWIENASLNTVSLATSSRFVGIGTSTASEALDVAGSIRNILHDDNSITEIASTTVKSPSSIAVSGKYAYVSSLQNELVIIDISEPSHPAIIATSSIDGNLPYQVAVGGGYAYTANEGDETVSVVDVTNPKTPSFVTSTSLEINPYTLAISGPHLYVVGAGENTLAVFNVANPTNPTLIATTTVGEQPAIATVTERFISLAGRYAYVTDPDANLLSVVDIINPSLPTEIATTTIANSPSSVAVSGRYAYTANGSFGGSMSVVDISDPFNPVEVASTTVGATSPRSITVSGRYAYVGASTNISVIDVYDPMNPMVVDVVPTSIYPFFITISGKYIYAVDSFSWQMSVNEIEGTESASLLAHSAEIGNLEVLNSANINNQFTIGGGLVVGSGGIFSNNGLGVHGTSTLADLTLSGRVNSNLLPYLTDTYSLGNTSYRWLGISAANVTTTNLAADYVTTSELWVGGTQITGAGSTSNLQQVTDVGATTTNRIQFAGATSTNNILPGTDNLFSLGSSSYRWSNLFAINASLVNVSSTNIDALGDVSTTNLSVSASTTFNGVEYLFPNADGLNNQALVTNGTGGLSWQTIMGSGGSNIWSENLANNTAHLTTSTRYVLLGGNTTSTAGFIWQPNNNGSSDLFIGHSTKTNAYYGTSTYGGGLHSSFSLDGNDVFVQGKLGAIGGLYSATSVIVGANSTIYGDGTLTKELGGKYSFDILPTTGSTSIESFESATFPPTGWSTDGDYLWSRNSTQSSDGTWSAYSGGLVKSTESYLRTTSTYSLAGTVSFDWWLNTGTGNYLNFCIDDNNCTSGADASRNGGSGTWLSVEIPVSPGEHTFTWRLNNSTGASNAAYVDNVAFTSGGSIEGYEFNVSSTHAMAIYENRNIGMGTGATVPTNKLTVVGNIQNTLEAGQEFSVATSTDLVSGAIADLYVAGDYLYLTVAEAAGTMQIFNIADKNNIFRISTTTLPHGSNHNRILVDANYLYTANPNSRYVQIIDISDPGSPFMVTSTYLGSITASANDIAVNGNYLYVLTYEGLKVLNIGDINNPYITTSTNQGGRILYKQGRFLYSEDNNSSGNDYFYIIDTQNPESPQTVGTISLNVSYDPSDIYVKGGYAYITAVGGYTAPRLLVVDISDVTNPNIIKTVSLSAVAERLHGSGRYLYLTNHQVFDIDDPTNPVKILDNSISSNNVFSAGRYTYFGNNPWPGGDLVIMDNGGIETNGIEAHNAQLGSVQILGDARVMNQLNVNNGMSVGSGGIYTGGGLVTVATSSLSDINILGRVNSNLLPYLTDTYTLGNSNYRWLGLNVANVTTTNLAASYVTTSELWVDGTQITGAESQSLQDVTDIGATTTNRIQFAGATSTNNILPGTDNLFSLGSSSYRWANLFAINSSLVNVSSTNIDALGYVSTTNLYASESILGNATTTNLYNSGTVSTTNLYVNGTQITGVTPTLQQVTDQGYITSNPIGFAGASSTGHFLPTANNSYDLGSPSFGWRNIYASNGIFTNVSSTNIDALSYVSTTNLYVNGTQITGAESQSLQDVTDIGATTTNRIQFAGATSTNNILPGTNLAYDLGSSAYRWDELWVSSTHIGGSTWDLRQDGNGYFTIAENGGASRLTMDTNGRFGFGTTTPDALMHIYGSSDAPQVVVQANSTQDLSNPLIQFRNSNGTVIGGITTNATTNIFAGLSAGESVSSGDNNSFFGSESGMFVTTGDENTAVGSQALNGNWDNISGSYNTAIGSESMYGLSGNSITGNYNSALGYQSLLNINTGHDNTAIGSYTLRSLTSGYENTALGSTALEGTTTGIKNIGIGFQAAWSNSTGTANIAIGNEALYNNNGDDNVAIGKNASYIATGTSETIAVGYEALFTNNVDGNVGIGFNAVRANSSGARLSGVGRSVMINNTSGSDNTAIGYESSYFNETGSYNTSLGSNAMYGAWSNSHSHNTGIGYNSLFSVTTGSNNTGLGSGSLATLTTGASNTAIGYNAGSNLTSGANNIIIGSNTNAPSAAGNNQLNIGNALYGNLDNSYIGIGDSSPASLFTVGSGDTFQVDSSGDLARINNVPYAWPAGNSAGSLTNDGSGNLSWSSSSGLTSSTAFIQNGNSFGASAVLGTNDAHDLQFETDGVSRAAITNAGWFGIGTNNPTNPFTIVSSTQLNGQDQFLAKFEDGSNSGVDGGVLVSSFYPRLTLNDRSANANFFDYHVNTDDFYLSVGSNADLHTRYADLMHVSASGTMTMLGAYNETQIVAKANAAQTNANPLIKLQDSSNNELARLHTDDNSNIFAGYQAGLNNGIGSGLGNAFFGSQAGLNNTSGDNNTVMGTGAFVSNQAGVNNAAFGYEAMNGNGGTHDYSYNTAMGYRSMYSVQDNSTSNSAFGNNSLYSITTGDYNTAVGRSALQNTQSGNSNVGIGNNALGQQTTQSNSTAVGYAALYFNTASNNSALGYHAGYYNQTGTGNLALGYLAMEGNSFYTNSNNNTAVGYEAITNITSNASQNSALGYRSLYSLTSGTSNTAVGFESLYSNTTGYNNVAMGAGAMRTPSNSLRNVAIGVDALRGGASADPDRSVAIGFEAGSSITTGDNSTLVGYQAGNNLTTGGSNTAVGLSALNTMTGGVDNTAIGNNAMFGATGGDYNVGVGGYTLNALSTGDNNVAVGYNAGGSISSGSNNVFLGYNARSGGNYSTATAIGYNVVVGASNRAHIGNGQSVGGSSSWNVWSDMRLKYNIVDNHLGLNFINKLSAKNFRYTTSSGMAYAGQLEEGFIAQEVEQVINDLGVSFSGLSYPENPNDYYRLSYGKFVVPLVNSVQEIYASSSPLWNGIAINQNFVTTSEPFMQVDLDGNISYKGTSITAKGTATTSTTSFDSYTFSYQGSAWNNDTAQEITTSFDVYNNTIHASSSELKFIYTTGTGFSQDLLTITNSGDVHVSGDLHVGRRLYLGSKSTGEGSTSTYIFVDDTLGASSTYIATNADGWQTETTYDYAERYESDQDLQPGDLVTVDPAGVNKVKRASSPAEPLLGIVSTKPGFVTGRHYDGWHPVALAGRVPTRVSTINGAIKAGDYITASDIPGVGVKSADTANVIGIALESYDLPGEGIISVFVKSIGSNKGVQAGIVYGPEKPAQTQATTGFAMISAGQKEVNVTFDSVGGYPLIKITPYGNIQGSYYLGNVSDTGFTVVLSQEQTFDLMLAYEVDLPTSDKVALSDGTTAIMDDLTGAITYSENTEPEVSDTDDQTSTSTPATAPDDSQSSADESDESADPAGDATTSTATGITGEQSTSTTSN